jgi:hypothetical protein
MGKLTIYVQPINRKKPYGGYKYDSTEYEVWVDGEKRFETDSIYLSNRNYKRGVAGVKQMIKKMEIEYSEIEVTRFSTKSINY